MLQPARVKNGKLILVIRSITYIPDSHACMDTKMLNQESCHALCLKGCISSVCIYTLYQGCSHVLCLKGCICSVYIYTLYQGCSHALCLKGCISSVYIYTCIKTAAAMHLVCTADGWIKTATMHLVCTADGCIETAAMHLVCTAVLRQEPSFYSIRLH